VGGSDFWRAVEDYNGWGKERIFPSPHPFYSASVVVLDSSRTLCEGPGVFHGSVASEDPVNLKTLGVMGSARSFRRRQTCRQL